MLEALELQHTTTTIFSVSLLVLVIVLFMAHHAANVSVHISVPAVFIALSLISSLSGFIVNAIALNKADGAERGTTGFNTAFGLILQLTTAAASVYLGVLVIQVLRR